MLENIRRDLGIATREPIKQFGHLAEINNGHLSDPKDWVAAAHNGFKSAAFVEMTVWGPTVSPMICPELYYFPLWSSAE